MSEETMFMGLTDTADVHIQGSTMASEFIKMHKGTLQGHTTCINLEKNKLTKHSTFLHIVCIHSTRCAGAHPDKYKSAKYMTFT